MNADEDEAIGRLERAVIAMWAMQGEDISEDIGYGTLAQRINACAAQVEAAG